MTSTLACEAAAGLDHENSSGPEDLSLRTIDTVWAAWGLAQSQKERQPYRSASKIATLTKKYLSLRCLLVTVLIRTLSLPQKSAKWELRSGISGASGNVRRNYVIISITTLGCGGVGGWTTSVSPLKLSSSISTFLLQPFQETPRPPGANSSLTVHEM